MYFRVRKSANLPENARHHPGRARLSPAPTSRTRGPHRDAFFTAAAPSTPAAPRACPLEIQTRTRTAPGAGLGYLLRMRYVEVSGVRLSVVGLGTWQFGSPEWGYGRAFADGEALRITQRALDLGINLIDTAELYGLGRSERAVGKAIVGRRDEAFVATKVLPVVPFDPVVHQRALASRRRLGIDRIDLYQAHWPNPVFPLPPLFQAMGRLQREGIVTHIGVSNYSLSQWQE